MKVYLNPNQCAPCRYKPQLRLIGKYCQESGTKIELIEQTSDEAAQTLPYVEINGKTEPLVQITAKKLSQLLQ